MYLCCISENKFVAHTFCLKIRLFTIGTSMQNQEILSLTFITFAVIDEIHFVYYA